MSQLKSHSLCLYLDQITDPQNFGAIIRSCYYFKVDALLVSHKSKCPLNSTVSKTSSGALELVDVCEVKDIVGFMRDWKGMNEPSRVLCTGAESKEGLPLIKLDQYNKNGNELVLIGSEGAGVSPHLMR